MVEDKIDILDQKLIDLDVKINSLNDKIETTEDPNLKYITQLDTAEKIKAYEINRKYNFKEKLWKNLTRIGIVLISAVTTLLGALQYAV